jgi:hypothetical protein
MIYDAELAPGITTTMLGPLYAAAYCANGGAEIQIGVFTDPQCNNLAESFRVNDYLVAGDGYQLRLNHVLLRKTYGPEQPLSCLTSDKTTCYNL